MSRYNYSLLCNWRKRSYISFHWTFCHCNTSPIYHHHFHNFLVSTSWSYRYVFTCSSIFHCTSCLTPPTLSKTFLQVDSSFLKFLEWQSFFWLRGKGTRNEIKHVQPRPRWAKLCFKWILHFFVGFYIYICSNLFSSLDFCMMKGSGAWREIASVGVFDHDDGFGADWWLM